MTAAPQPQSTPYGVLKFNQSLHIYKCSVVANRVRATNARGAHKLRTASQRCNEGFTSITLIDTILARSFRRVSRTTQTHFICTLTNAYFPKNSNSHAEYPNHHLKHLQTCDSQQNFKTNVSC